MGAAAIGADNLGGTKPGRTSGEGTIEIGYATTGKNRLYQTVNDPFSTQKQRK